MTVNTTVAIVCPIDRTPLSSDNTCPSCDFSPVMTEVKGRTIPDYRVQNVSQQVTQTFTLPVVPLDRDDFRKQVFRAVNMEFDHIAREDIRKQYGTKIDKGIQYYCQQILQERGPDVAILDLGCGNGGNRRYLHSLGFTNVTTVDWAAVGADLLVDAHRLPFLDDTFGMVISTAVFEHLYNPFIAMSEVTRVLDGQGVFVGGASFWEGWHGSSYFHMTPDGWNAILAHNGMRLEDLWAGWGITPAALSHALTPGRNKRLGYLLHNMVERAYRLYGGEDAVNRFRLRASGSYSVFAVKTAP